MALSPIHLAHPFFCDVNSWGAVAVGVAGVSGSRNKGSESPLGDKVRRPPTQRHLQ